MVLTMFMKMAMSMGGNSPPEITLPGMRMVADYEVTRASGDRAEYKFAYNEVPELVPTPDANPMVMSQLRSSLEGIRGLRGSGAVTPRGAMLDTEIEMGPGADPQIAQFVESMRQSMRQLVVPLPEEPVGAGAKWTALQHMELNKMEIFQVAQFEMLSRDGDDIALKVSIEQGAPPQKVQAPGMPPGAKVRLDKMRSGGEGQMKISLTALTPTSDVKLDSDIAMTVEAAGEKIDMKMNMTVRMTIAEL
jgi:hypothetical protein